MDIARTDFAAEQIRRRLIWAGLVISITVAVSLGLSRLRPAGPVVSKASIWTGRVQNGTMMREVRGIGVLTPVEIRWIAAQQQARVERIVTLPGARVTRDSVILELSSPEIVQAAADAQLALQAARSELASHLVQIESTLLSQRAAAATVNAEAEEAERKLKVEEDLASQGLTSRLTLELARTRAAETSTRREIEKQRVAIGEEAARAQRSMFTSKVDQLRTVAELRARQRDGLIVRAGIDGIVQQVPVEVGQQVAPGTTLAKVAQPERLKAELKIAETQARDIAMDQRVTIDTRNGIVNGSVMRVDPAVRNGTVTVDVALPTILPKGARPDLTVDGTIELDRLTGVRYVTRPMQADENSTVSLFRVVDNGSAAERVQVRVGRVSANAIEILGGLDVGDEIILSDVSAWSGHERLRLKD